MQLLNLGCGQRFHSAWTNIDFISTGHGVIAHNLNHGIPFPDASFDVVYHSHVLEHFSITQAPLLLQECYRVLRPQGVIRVAVPNLEQIARTYLMALENANAGSLEWATNYDWIMLELYDQAVRNQPGGAMAAYLFRDSIVNTQFVVERCGVEAKNLIDMGQKQREAAQSMRTAERLPIRYLKALYRFIRYDHYRREVLLKFILGDDYQALQIGRFRQSGEVHQWMYDRYSLAKLLRESGFQNIVEQTAQTSYVPNWSEFYLDTEMDGTVYKPESLFMEGRKPDK